MALPLFGLQPPHPLPPPSGLCLLRIVAFRFVSANRVPGSERASIVSYCSSLRTYNLFVRALLLLLCARIILLLYLENDVPKVLIALLLHNLHERVVCIIPGRQQQL